jgi:aspartyl/asparaginyl-tRNA synthetase
VFRLDYFQGNAYLAQSPQLYKQMAVQARFPRIMEIGPVFRAENSFTARHLTEFTGLDLEMEIEEDYHEVVDLLEEMMLFIFRGLGERYSKETELIGKVYPVQSFKLPEKVPRLHFAEGIKLLREAGEEIGEYDDLTTPQEKRLGQLVLEKVMNDFLSSQTSIVPHPH